MKHVITAELEISEEALRAEIVDQAVRALVGVANNPPLHGSKYAEEWDEEEETEVSPVSASARNVTFEFMQRVRAIQDSEVRALVKDTVIPVIKDALDTTTIPRTNQYGEPRGSAMTLTEFVMETVRTELSKTNSNYGRGESVIAKLIREEIQNALSKELSEDISKAKAEVRAAVQSQAAAMIQKAITDVAGVKL